MTPFLNYLDICNILQNIPIIKARTNIPTNHIAGSEVRNVAIEVSILPNNEEKLLTFSPTF